MAFSLIHSSIFFLNPSYPDRPDLDHPGRSLPALLPTSTVLHLPSGPELPPGFRQRSGTLAAPGSMPQSPPRVLGQPDPVLPCASFSIIACRISFAAIAVSSFEAVRYQFYFITAGEKREAAGAGTHPAFRQDPWRFFGLLVAQTFFQSLCIGCEIGKSLSTTAVEIPIHSR